MLGPQKSEATFCCFNKINKKKYLTFGGTEKPTEIFRDYSWFYIGLPPKRVTKTIFGTSTKPRSYVRRPVTTYP